MLAQITLFYKFCIVLFVSSAPSQEIGCREENISEVTYFMLSGTQKLNSV